MNATGFSPEFLLVAACCRPRTFADFDDAVRRAASGGWDATAIVASARAHRVEGFVDEGLKRAGIELPAAAAELLAARAAASRVQMLRNAGEEVRIAGLFAGHGIEPLFVKGATLALLAHGSLALKTSWDIDMLVAPEQLAAARMILPEAGYRLDLPGIDDPVLIDTAIRRSKETIWVNQARGTFLELHTALIEANGLLRGVGTQSPRQMVTVAKESTLATLAPEQLLAYLCVHGTMHRWERLKWLTDVAALLRTGRIDADVLLETSRSHGAGHAAATGLEMAHRLFGLQFPGFPPHRSVTRLTAISLAALQTNETPESMSGLTVAQLIDRFRAQWLQADGLRARLSVIGSLLDYSPDRRTPCRTGLGGARAHAGLATVASAHAPVALPVVASRKYGQQAIGFHVLAADHIHIARPHPDMRD